MTSLKKKKKKKGVLNVGNDTCHLRLALGSDSVPECRAVERAQGWASDNLGPSPCSMSKQLRDLS